MLNPGEQLQRAREALKHQIKQAVKKAARRLAGKVIVYIGQVTLVFLGPVGIVVLAVVFAGLLVAAAFGAFPVGDSPGGPPILAGVHSDQPVDQKILQEYEDLVSVDWGQGKPAWNAADTWLVDGESYGTGKTFYPGTGTTNLHQLADEGHKDYDLRLQWGTVHAVCLFWAYTYSKPEIPDSMRAKVAKDLHPFFYYMQREDTSTTCCQGKCTTTKWPVYLLVEAHTIEGFYQYHYKQVTTTTGGGG